jgi:hypothetical protein
LPPPLASLCPTLKPRLSPRPSLAGWLTLTWHDAVLYELLLGEPPFDPFKLPRSDPEYHLKKHVRAAHYPGSPWSPRAGQAEGWSDLSEEAIEVLTHLLVASPAKRLSSWEALTHPWLKGRHRDSASVTGSTLKCAKANMVRRQSQMSGRIVPPSNNGAATAPMPAAPQPLAEGGGEAAGGEAGDGEAAGSGETAMEKMMAPRRPGSVIFDVREARNDGGDDEEVALDEAYISVADRASGVASYNTGGLDETSVTIGDASGEADTGQLEVEVRLEK